LDSKEHRDGTSLANNNEAQLAIHLYTQLYKLTNGLSAQRRVAIITPYARQANLLQNCFAEKLGPDYERHIEVNIVDCYQDREENIVIFSCVHAAGSHGCWVLERCPANECCLDSCQVFPFVIARCKSIVVNQYWRDLVDHARDTNAVVSVQRAPRQVRLDQAQDQYLNGNNSSSFPDLDHSKHETSNP